MRAEPQACDIVAQARTWLGTPFHHQGRLKGVGVDCAGLLVGTLRELGRVVAEIPNYDHRPDARLLRTHLDATLRRIRRRDVLAGDVLLMTFTVPHEATHLALRTDVGILHAHAPSRAVVETVIDPILARAFVQAYRFPWLL